MNTRNIAMLAIITLVVVLIATQFSGSPEKTEETQAGQMFFPELLGELKNIDAIHIKTAKEDFTVNKSNETWGLASSHNYPVAMDQVSKVLNGMASFVLLEKKTAKPELYERLDLKDVTDADSKATLIELKKGQVTLAGLLLGKSQVAKSDNTRTEMYVRKPDEAQTWLVMGTLSYITNVPKEWLDKSISDIDVKRIRSVSIARKEAEPVEIFKDKETDSDYQLADLPADATVGEMYKLSNLARSLSGLNMDDVVPAEGFEFDDTAAQVVFSSFDGLEVTAQAMQKDDKYYLRLHAVAKPDMAVPLEIEEAEAAKSEAKASEAKAAEVEAEKPAEIQEAKETTEQRNARVAKEVEAFNAKVAAWVYVIPEYSYKNLLPAKADLFKLKEQAEETPAASDAIDSSQGSTEMPALNLNAAPLSVEAALATESSSVEEKVENKASAAAAENSTTKLDLAEMLKQAAERAKNNPPTQDALGQALTVQNVNGEQISLPDLFRKAAERAKQEQLHSTEQAKE